MAEEIISFLVVRKMGGLETKFLQRFRLAFRDLNPRRFLVRPEDLFHHLDDLA